MGPGPRSPASVVQTCVVVQLTAITWLKEFVELAGAALLPFASGVLAAVLPCLAYADDPRNSILATGHSAPPSPPPTVSLASADIRETAATVNFQLSKLVVAEAVPPGDDTAKGEGGEVDEGTEGLRVDAVVGVLTQMLHHNSVHTKVAALDWILQLYNKLPAEVSQCLRAGISFFLVLPER